MNRESNRTIRSKFTILVVSSALTLCLAAAGVFYNERDSLDPAVDRSADADFILGRGMGPNLMTHPEYQWSDQQLEASMSELEDVWSLDSPTMRIIVTSHGTESYIDYGDGIWVTKNAANSSSELDPPQNPFEADSNPFDHIGP